MPVDHDVHERARHGGLVEGQRAGIGHDPTHRGPEQVSAQRRQHQRPQCGDAGPAVDLPGHQPPDREAHWEPVQHDGHRERRVGIERERGQRGTVEPVVNDESGEAGQQRQAVGWARGAPRGLLDCNGDQEPGYERQQDEPVPLADRCGNEREEYETGDRRPGQPVEHRGETAPVAGARVQEWSGGEGSKGGDQVRHFKAFAKPYGPDWMVPASNIQSGEQLPIQPLRGKRSRRAPFGCRGMQRTLSSKEQLSDTWPRPRHPPGRRKSSTRWFTMDRPGPQQGSDTLRDRFRGESGTVLVGLCRKTGDSDSGFVTLDR